MFSILFVGGNKKLTKKLISIQSTSLIFGFSIATNVALKTARRRGNLNFHSTTNLKDYGSSKS
jgi:hypothetical protein